MELWTSEYWLDNPPSRTLSPEAEAGRGGAAAARILETIIRIKTFLAPPPLRDLAPSSRPPRPSSSLELNLLPRPSADCFCLVSNGPEWSSWLCRYEMIAPLSRAAASSRLVPGVYPRCRRCTAQPGHSRNPLHKLKPNLTYSQLSTRAGHEGSRCEDFTITEKAPTRDFSWWKAPTCFHI